MKGMIKLMMCCTLVAGTCNAKCGFATTPVENAECFKQLKKLFEEQFNLNAHLTNDTRFVHYAIVATTSGKAAKTYESDIKIYINKRGTKLESKDLELYQDEHALVSVLPGRKMIFIQQPPPDQRKWQAARLKQVAVLQDSLFHYAETKDCSIIKPGSDSKGQQVKVALTAVGVKRFRIKSITFEMNERASRINGFTIDYDAGHRLNALQCVFKELDYHYPSRKLGKSALAAVMDESKSLLPRFRDFKLIDNRKKRP